MANRFGGYIAFFELRGDSDETFREANRLTTILKNDVRPDNPNVRAEFDTNFDGNTSVSIEDISERSARRIIAKVRANNIGFNHQVVRSFDEITPKPDKRQRDALARALSEVRFNG